MMKDSIGKMKNVQEFVHYRERDGRKIIYSKYISNVIITMATSCFIGKTNVIEMFLYSLQNSILLKC